MPFQRLFILVCDLLEIVDFLDILADSVLEAIQLVAVLGHQLGILFFEIRYPFIDLTQDIREGGLNDG